METPVLYTERIILRPISVADSKTIYDRWTSDAEVAKYMRWCVHANVEDTIEWLKCEEKNNKGNDSYQWGFWLKEEEYLFGSGGLIYRAEEDVFEVGYNIMKQYWNQGYTTEAVKEMLKFAQNELGVHNFVACHAIENPASGEVLKKCGFVYERPCQTTKFDGITTFDCKEYRLRS